MKLAIMQPYFFPYIGYFQLINSVDEFVIYDNIKYSRNSWINRNRILINSKDDFITLPIKKDSDLLNVNQRFLADTWQIDRKKMLNRLFESYRKAPQFEQVFELFEKCIMFEELNLFNFILNSLKETLYFLNIDTRILISSNIKIDHSFRSESKVIAICKELNSTTYINPSGGVELYNKERFELNGVKLRFQKSNPITYSQFNHSFVPWLSILDVLMFNTKEEVNMFLSDYSLV